MHHTTPHHIIPKPHHTILYTTTPYDTTTHNNRVCYNNMTENWLKDKVNRILPSMHPTNSNLMTQYLCHVFGSIRKKR